MSDRPTLAPEAKRKVLRSIPYGLYVATAAGGDLVAAGTITWLSQASFSPPLIMAAIKVGSRLHAAIDAGGGFALHVVGEAQQDLAAAFLKPTSLEGGTINGLAHEPGPAMGAPILAEFPMWCEVKVVGSVAQGDHTVFVAEVVACGVRDDDARPLALRDTGWTYGG